jgi:hypothetical protein
MIETGIYRLEKKWMNTEFITLPFEWFLNERKLKYNIHTHNTHNLDWNKIKYKGYLSKKFESLGLSLPITTEFGLSLPITTW